MDCSDVFLKISIVLSVLLYLLSFILYSQKISTDNNIKNNIIYWSIWSAVGSIAGSLIVFCFSQNNNYFLTLILHFLLLISSFLVLYFFRRQSINSFPMISSKILKYKQSSYKISEIMGSLQDNLKLSDEEILLKNLYLAGKNIAHWYNFIFAMSITTIFFIVLYKSPFGILANLLLIYFSPTVIMYFLVFVCLKYKKSLLVNINKSSIFKLFLGLFFNVLIIYSSEAIFIVILYIFLKFFAFIKLINIESINNSVTNISYIDLSNLYTLNKLNGNLFSLAALYFTLAFTGTVVFSLAHIYSDRKENVAKKDSELSEKYEKWFVKYKKCIDLMKM